ncbi:hypothetical protein ADJ79_12025 [Ottowia sp. oral taxon 894]|nr:hypothetical protein ADJ79_12025 [Ottowia sp. oral taxon 894]
MERRHALLGVTVGEILFGVGAAGFPNLLPFAGQAAGVIDDMPQFVQQGAPKQRATQCVG